MDSRLFFTLLLFSFSSVVLADLFTSLVDMDHMVMLERKLVLSLKTYLDLEMGRLRDLKRFFSKVSRLHSDVYQVQTTALTNPLLSFALIKRLHSEWPLILYKEESLQHLQDLRSGYEQDRSALPCLEDLKGAVGGLLRLQDVYSLQVSALVRGLFIATKDGGEQEVHRPQVSVPLSPDDCYTIGKVAYDQEDFFHSVPWLEEAVLLFRRRGSRPENQGSMRDALDHLAFSYFREGNVSSALSLTLELLRLDPGNQRLQQNVEKYEKLLSRPQTKVRIAQRPASRTQRTREAYKRLCRTQGSQTGRFQNPRLVCDLFTGARPGLVLGPAKREVLSLRPLVVLYHGFVTDSEAEEVRTLARPGLRRSVVASGEQQATADYRISKSAWLKDSSHSVIWRLDRRIAMVTGLNVSHPFGEYLQVVNYGIGGQYEPHYDHATVPTSPVYKLNTGNRLATFMIYLSSVEAGGSTAFIYANFSVPVVEKAGIFWWNLHRNGEGDVHMLHAGCPVLVGDKWVANKWIHEHGQEFNNRCSLNPNE